METNDKLPRDNMVINKPNPIITLFLTKINLSIPHYYPLHPSTSI